MNIFFKPQQNTYSPSFQGRHPKINLNLSKEQLDEFVRTGKSVKEIAQQHNVSAMFIYKLMQELNVKSPQKAVKVVSQNSNEALMVTIPTLIRQNATVDEIVKKTGCTSSEINKFVKNNFNKNIREMRREMLIDAYEKGLSDAEISETFHLTPKSAVQLRYHYGLRIPKDVKQLAESIREKFKQGLKEKDIADEVDISEKTVQVYKKKYKMKQDIIEFRRSMILQKINEGLNFGEVAKEMDISRGTLRAYIKDCGLENAFSDYQKRLKKVLREKYETGTSVQKLSEEYGLSMRTVHYKLKK